MRKRPLAYVACVFLAGLACWRYEAEVLWLVLGLLIFWEIWLGAKTKKVLKTAGRSFILLSAFLLGILWMQREENFREVYMSKIEDGSEVTVWGELIKTETTEWGKRGILSDCYIRLEGDIIPCNDIMVYLSSNHFQMGQIHKVTGQLKTFIEARNQGNFNQKLYYHSQKIDFAIYEENCSVLSEGLGEWKKNLLLFRNEISTVYDNSMKEKAAGFYQGMVLGDKTNLDETIKDLFTLGGISHILAISGLHVSIIGRGIYQWLRRMGIGFLPSGIVGGCLLISYCIMVGNGMSTIRAVGMMLLYFWAQWIGKSYDMLNALGAMVLILLWENPFLIEYSGFWFSVMALIGVGFVGRELSTCTKRGSGIWMSIGITLSTLPVTACSYFEIPMYSPLVNFLALPLLTPVFCLAIIGGVLGIWFPTVAFVLLQPCEWLLIFYEWLCSTVAKLPGASIICGMPSVSLVMVYYVILFVGIFLLRRIERWQFAFALCLFCFFLIAFPKSKPFEITFLDVGQGDGIYISGGDGTTYFIDGGSSNVNEVGEYRILPFLKAKGVKDLDYWFVSHCDTDHISGLLEVLETGYEIEYLVLAKECPKDEMYESLLIMAQEAEVEVLHMDVGHRICSDNMEITCLAPGGKNGPNIGEDRNEISQDRNESSLVLELKWKQGKGEQSFKALFAGDISTATEDKLCRAGLLEDVDLFKAIHHGSNYSNGSLILEKLQPEYIVVSCGENNLYGHPGAQAVERMEGTGAELFYTMEGGQITIQIDKMGLVSVGEFLVQ